MDSTTTDVTDLGTRLIIVRNVPCYKCEQCSEITFDLVVGERLEQIVDALRDTISEIAVVQYSVTAA